MGSHRQTFPRHRGDMVCHKEEIRDGRCIKRKKGGGEVTATALKKKTQKKNILKQYRKLIAVLPNICSKSRVSKQSVVEEAIIYIEELQKQLVNTMETGEDCENWKDNKNNDDQRDSVNYALLC